MTDNPFLLPPGAAPRPRSEPAVVPPIVRPVMPPVHNPDGYIAVPPSVSSSIPAWSLVLPDGRRVRLEGAVLLGRDPAPDADQPEAELVALTDPGKTVSKTHARFEPVGGVIRIRDLNSTNGVAITVDGMRTVLPAGGRGTAPSGAIVELGSATILIDGA